MSAPRFEDFRAQVDTEFRVVDHDFPLRLVEAHDLETEASGRPQSLRAPFSLIFEGPKAMLLAQGTFHLEHPDLGTHPIFLVPVGPRDELVRYEAVFA